MKRGRSQDPSCGTTFGRRFGTSIEFRLLLRLSQLLISRLRVTIREAASRLGVTEAAIRKRIQRGSLHKEMGEDSRVYVYLDLYQDMSHPKSQVDHEALVRNCGIASAS